MKTFTLKAFVVSVCLLICGVAVQAQGKKKGTTITTSPKLVVTKLKISEGEIFEVRGKATFTLAAANSDDSLVGTVNYSIPDDARAKIAQVTGKPIAQIPQIITQPDVVGQFQKLTECPIIHLDFPAMDLKVAGANLHFNRFVLDINDNGQEINLMVCTIARQINRGLPRRGPIRKVNEIINGEESQ